MHGAGKSDPLNRACFRVPGRVGPVFRFGDFLSPSLHHTLIFGSVLHVHSAGALCMELSDAGNNKVGDRSVVLQCSSRAQMPVDIQPGA